MARSKTTWQPGQTGNPNKKRPPPQRPLASALAKAGNTPGPDGRTPKEVVSGLIWQFMQTGQVVFESEEEGTPTRTLRSRTIQEWIDGMKFVYRHLDGDAPKHLSVATPDLNPAGVAYEALSQEEKATLREAMKQAAATAFEPDEVPDETSGLEEELEDG